MQRTTAGIVLAAVLLAACSASSEKRVIVTPGDAVRALNATSARVEIKIPSSDGAQFDRTMTGVYDFAKNNASFVEKSERLGSFESRFVGGIGYLQMDGGELPGEESYMQPDDPCFEKAWGYIDPADIGADRPTAAESILGTKNPLAGIASLKEAGGKLVEDGTISVRGTQAHLFTVDPASFGKHAPFADADAQITLKEMKVAVDDAGRPVKLDYTTHDDLADYDERNLVELWDFGVAVDVKKPPADQTCDFMASLGKSMDEMG